MTEKGFIPLSSQLGIPGTSYRIQLGMINDQQVLRLLKGKDVIDTYICKDEDAGNLLRNMGTDILKRFNAQNELNHNAISIETNHELEEALVKLKSIMRQDNSKEVVIDRRYLPEIFKSSLIEILITDGLPVLKPLVLEYFIVNGILSKLEGQSIVFREETIP